MNLHEFIQLFVPPIYYKVKRKLFPPKAPVVHPLPQLEEMGERLIIIGNGPSLNKTMELYEQQILESDAIMVNYSASTSLFERIQPRYYVMTDILWVTEKGEKRASMDRCIEAIVKKTQWPMTIILPKAFVGWSAISKFQENDNITVIYDESRWIKMPDEQLFSAFDKNILCPPSYTVLTYCLYLALYWGYKETYLIGADTTFMQMAYVGQKDNVVYTVDHHFYNNDEVTPVTRDIEHNGRPYGMNMEQYAEMCYNVFYEYHLLARYAKWKGVKVYNASEFSMIDCFERKKLV